MQPVTIALRDLDIHIQARSIVIVRGNTATKTYSDPDDCARELHWYTTVPWAAPDLVDHGPRHLVMAAHPIASGLSDYRPVDELRDLLERLERRGISHRDVHTGNVVATDDGPRLIDWETAIDIPGYDLGGPASDIPVPAIHDGEAMWWNADHPQAIGTAWGMPVDED